MDGRARSERWSVGRAGRSEAVGMEADRYEPMRAIGSIVSLPLLDLDASHGSKIPGIYFDSKGVDVNYFLN
jgi:hypothetical protein